MMTVGEKSEDLLAVSADESGEVRHRCGMMIGVSEGASRCWTLRCSSRA
jgi:hypothetical protein